MSLDIRRSTIETLPLRMIAGISRFKVEELIIPSPPKFGGRLQQRGSSLFGPRTKHSYVDLESVGGQPAC